MQFSPQALLKILRSLGAADDAALCVAYSGGLDSTVLLHALAQIVRDQASYRVRAAHIDHQLQPASARWRSHCGANAVALGISCVQRAVLVETAQQGVEASARQARYDALREILQPDEILLTAHHADDQLETMLLALVRGAGVQGLSGVAASQPFGRGRLVRPLLGFTRAELAEWARAQGLSWIDDPSNENIDLDRNYLRRQIAPLLSERWPAAARSAARSAGHLAEAAQILRSQAEADLSGVAAGDCLRAVQLGELDPARRRNLLRHWMRQRGARTPSSRKLAEIEHSLLRARPDCAPCVQWDDVEVRRYRGLLYLEPQLPPLDAAQTIDWDASQPIELPAGLGRLRLRPDPSGNISVARLSEPLVVRFRAGGESLRPAGDAHRRTLKKILQSAGVPPWRRARLPLVYCGQRLAAVADLWVAEEFAAHGDEAAVRIVWERE